MSSIRRISMTVVMLLIAQQAVLAAMPLFDAAATGSYEPIRSATLTTKDLSQQDADGNTPLHFALMNGHVAIANVFIKGGAPHERRNKGGKTPLDILKERRLVPADAVDSELPKWTTALVVRKLSEEFQRGHGIRYEIERARSRTTAEEVSRDVVFDGLFSLPPWERAKRSAELLDEFNRETVRTGSVIRRLGHELELTILTLLETSETAFGEHDPRTLWVCDRLHGRKPQWPELPMRPDLSPDAQKALRIYNAAASDASTLSEFGDDGSPYSASLLLKTYRAGTRGQFKRPEAVLNELLQAHPTMILPSACLDVSELHLAIIEGHGDLARLLLEYGANPNQASPRKVESEGRKTPGPTPLIHACEHGRLALAELLLQCGADPNHKAYDFFRGSFLESTPITAAVKSLSLLELLVEYGAAPDLPIRDEAHYLTPLMQTAKRGQLVQTVSLLKVGADPRCNLSGFTPESFAIMGGNVAVLQHIRNAPLRQAK